MRWVIRWETRDDDVGYWCKNIEEVLCRLIGPFVLHNISRQLHLSQNVVSSVLDLQSDAFGIQHCNADIILQAIREHGKTA